MSESDIPMVWSELTMPAVSMMLRLAALTTRGSGAVGTSKFVTYAHTMAMAATAITVVIAQRRQWWATKRLIATPGRDLDPDTSEGCCTPKLTDELKRRSANPKDCYVFRSSSIAAPWDRTHRSTPCERKPLRISAALANEYQK